jgi:hypothetical protein
MKTKVLALTITFAAVTIFLNPRFSGLAIPSFVPTLWFQFWEIPVFAAFLLFGFKPSLLVAVLNTTILLLISPGLPFNEPISNLTAVVSTLIGLWLADNLLIRKKIEEKGHRTLKGLIISTVISIMIRLVIMMPYIYVVCTIFGTIGLVIPLFSLIALYDTIVVIYSVPVAYMIAKAVSGQFQSAIEP